MPMLTFLSHNLNHLLFALLLLGRLGDILTTYLVTPTLKLEANALARKFRWPFAWATLLVAFVAYYSPQIAIVGIVVSLLISASNASKILTARIMGEEEYYRFTVNILLKSSPGSALLFMLLPVFFHTMLGFSLLIFYHNPLFDWGFYFALGFLTYAFAIAFHSTVFYFRLRRHRQQVAPAE